MNSPDFLFWSATRIAREIRDGNLTSSEVVGGCLDRIEQVNPKINAVVQLVAERALREAGEMDRLAARNQFMGPLHGVPISLKDSLDTAGMVSTGGTMGRKDFIPDEDAPVVQRLRAAGAVLMAKTNTPELTLSGETNNAIYGRTSNPYDLTRSPGGSSGASAALIAAGGAALELGSDTGGSIREPAHFCGITGLKPTSGRTPRTGHIVPHSGGVLDSLTQIGPMARYVEDLALALPIICGPDGVDSSVVPVPVRDPGSVDLSRLRIAFYTENGVTPLDENIGRVVTHAAHSLKDQGLQVEQVPLPGMQNLVELVSELRQVSNRWFICGLLDRYGTSDPGQDLAEYTVNFKLKTTDAISLELMASIDQAKSQALQFISKFDAIICPPSHTVARVHGASYADSYETWSYITIYNLLGWPGVVVRAGTSDNENLPVGVQVVTAPWREDIALAVAAKIESDCGGYQPPSI
jgi:amidase